MIRIHRYRLATMIGLAATAAAVFGWAMLAPAAAQGAYQSLANIVTCGTTAACVAGTNTSKGPGVQGVSAKGNGVVGQTNFNSTISLSRSGVVGQDLSTSIYGAGVTGTSATGTGVYATSSTGAAVVGRSGSSAGVLGQSKTANGVTATSVKSDGILSVTGFGGGASTKHSGVAGFDNSTSGSTNFGVFGGSTNGTGVAGKSTNGTGVAASSTTGTGMKATSESGSGVWGITGISGGSSSVSAGVYGSDYSSGSSSWGVAATSEHGVGFASAVTNGNLNFAITAFGGTADNTGGSIAAFDATGSRVLGVDNVGNVFINGLIYTQGTCITGCAKTHAGSVKRVVSYTPREALPTMEDNGQAQLANGSAYVAVDSAFSNVIDKASTYLVFITPDGDTRGLFVTGISAQGFTVRENQGGKSSVSFSYRIVAKPYGSNERRLPMMEIPTAAAPRNPARFKKPN